MSADLRAKDEVDVHDVQKVLSGQLECNFCLSSLKVVTAMPQGMCSHATRRALLELISHDMAPRVRRQTSFARDLEKMNQAWGGSKTSTTGQGCRSWEAGERERERERDRERARHQMRGEPRPPNGVQASKQARDRGRMSHRTCQKESM